METVVETMAPYFQAVGYDLSYEIQQQPQGIRLVSYIRIAPRGSTTVMGSTSTTVRSTLPTHQSEDGSIPRRGAFRVVIYGKGILMAFPNSENLFATLHDPERELGIDKFTWGAITTELWPLTVQYMQVKLGILLAMISVIVVFCSFSNRISQDTVPEVWQTVSFIGLIVY